MLCQTTTTTRLESAAAMITCFQKLTEEPFFAALLRADCAKRARKQPGSRLLLLIPPFESISLRAQWHSRSHISARSLGLVIEYHIPMSDERSEDRSKALQIERRQVVVVGVVDSSD